MINIIINIMGVLSIIYAVPYANYEYNKNNKKGAIIIYIIALSLFTLLIIKLNTIK